jgi:hypothetical protein
MEFQYLQILLLLQRLQTFWDEKNSFSAPNICYSPFVDMNKNLTVVDLASEEVCCKFTEAVRLCKVPREAVCNRVDGFSVLSSNPYRSLRKGYFGASKQWPKTQSNLKGEILVLKGL